MPEPRREGRRRSPRGIVRCGRCGQTQWGPVAEPLKERYGNEVVEVEQWGCLICHQRPAPQKSADNAPASSCKTCRGGNLLTDAYGPYCVDCRARPGVPRARRDPRRGPPPKPVHVHRLGETPPPYACVCGASNWFEGIYSWRCLACLGVEQKPAGGEWASLTKEGPFRG